MDNNSGTAPSQIIINGQEYSAEDAQRYVDLGRHTEEMEKQWNTKLDSVWPEYGRSRETIKTLEGELEQFKAKSQEGNATAKDAQDVKDAAQKAGFSVADLEKAGYIKKDGLDSYLDERDKKRDELSRATNAVLTEADKLQKEIDGSDGRPKFKKAAVMAYASQFGFNDLTKAYESMWEEEIKTWKDAQIEKERRVSLKTQKGGGEKTPTNPKVNNDNFDAALSEALWGAKE